MRDDLNRNNHDTKTVIVLGEGRYSVGPGIVPSPKDATHMMPAIVIARVQKVALLAGLDGKPLNAPPDIAAVIACPSRQAVNVVIRTCMEMLSMFEAADAEMKNQPKP